jgi:heme exporter protein A
LNVDPSAGLIVSSLEVWRGERRLFGDLSFELRPGQVALITGPNGAGKTSLLRILAGLSEPVAGAVTWRGTPVRQLAAELRAAIAYQGHLDGLKNDLTVVENLTFYRALWDGEDALEPLLDELRLSDFAHREVRYLSAGQRRRVGLGCMRLRRASLWLLDEPLTNLDAEGAEVVAGWLLTHTGAEGAAVLATNQAERFSGAAAIEIAL